MTAMPDPLLITVAPTGAETAKADCPQLPTTLEELVATARECEAAGAAMIHVHIRDDEHRPTLDGGRLKATVDALRESTDLVVQLSTGGSVHDPLETRLKVLDAAPDSCSLTMGTTNFGDDVFVETFSAPRPFASCPIARLASQCQHCETRVLRSSRDACLTDERGEIGHPARVSPFIVVPGDDLGEIILDHHRRKRVDDRRSRIVPVVG